MGKTTDKGETTTAATTAATAKAKERWSAAGVLDRVTVAALAAGDRAVLDAIVGARGAYTVGEDGSWVGMWSKPRESDYVKVVAKAQGMTASETCTSMDALRNGLLSVGLTEKEADAALKDKAGGHVLRISAPAKPAEQLAPPVAPPVE